MSRCIKLYRAYSISFNSSNLGNFFWSWILIDCIEVQQKKKKVVYYIHTEKYSPKSYVVNFRTQISSSQSEERTMVFTREKNDTSNQKPQRCEFRAKIPACHCSLQRHFAHIRREKFYSRVFLAKKVKNISEMEWNSFVCFTVVKENGIESRRNNSGKGKTEREVSFCCAFCRSYFALHLSLILYWNRPFYLNSLIFNCALRTNS